MAQAVTQLWGFYVVTLPQRLLRPLGNPLSGFSSPAECHQRHTVDPQFMPTKADTFRCPLLPRFFPLQRFTSYGELRNPSGLPPHRFGCALRVCCPLDALLPPQPAGLVSSRLRSWGFTLRGFVPLDDAVRPLERRYPLGVRPHECRPPLQGFSHRPESRLESWSLAKLLRRIPPWAFFPPRPLAIDGRLYPPKRMLALPSRAFSFGPRADPTAGTPGSQPPTVQSFSLETDMAPMGFSTSSIISTLELLNLAGLPLGGPPLSPTAPASSSQG